MKGAALFFLSLGVWAQAPAAASAPPSPPSSSATPPTLPKAAGCGASFSDPGWLGYCYLAIPVVPSQGVYSWTMYQFLPNGLHAPTVLTSTGGAMILRRWNFSAGTLFLIGVGAVGAAISSSAATFSPSGGGIAMWASKQGWTFEAGAIENKVGSVTQPQWIAGPGLTW